MEDEVVVIKNVRVEYLSTKKDKYNNEINYFKIRDKSIDQKFSAVAQDGFNLPWFKTDKGHTLLKVKSKYVKVKSLNKDDIVVAEIVFTQYNMNGIDGFYVSRIV